MNKCIVVVWVPISPTTKRWLFVFLDQVPYRGNSSWNFLCPKQLLTALSPFTRNAPFKGIINAPRAKTQVSFAGSHWHSMSEAFDQQGTMTILKHFLVCFLESVHVSSSSFLPIVSQLAPHQNLNGLLSALRFSWFTQVFDWTWILSYVYGMYVW